MERLAERPDGSQCWHATWKELREVAPQCDLLCVDAPYSEKTHKGHDDGAATADRARSWAESEGKTSKRPNAKNEKRYAATVEVAREKLNYAHWTTADVDAFVDAWAPHTKGWFASLTDDVLAPVWAAALERHGLYVFSPLACVEPGSRVRMVGDGPSQWSCFLVLARPKHAPFSKWGAMPGAYVVPPGACPRPGNGGKAVTGGKPMWLMERIVSDYSRLGDLVIDPCAGGGTTGLAAIRTGRRAIIGDMDRATAADTAKAFRKPIQAPLLATRSTATPATQLTLSL